MADKLITLQDGRQGWFVQTGDAVLLQLKGEGGLCIPVPCSWFALCDEPATTTVPHPILGEVPICTHCNAKMERAS